MNTQQHTGAAERIPGEMGTAHPIVAEVAAGAAAGALVGAITGPPGAAIGAIIGGAVGAMAGVAIERGELEKRLHDAQLDRDIGVIGGTIGEPKLQHPPPVHGLYHAATLGVGGEGIESSDGPIQNVDGAE